MRVIFLSMALLLVLPSAFCQNSLPSKSNANLSEQDRWNLDKYVYSHTNYRNGSKDKPVIDFDAIDNWRGVDENVTISDDGYYFVYKIITGRGVVSYNRKKPDSLIVQSTSGSWRFSYAGNEPGFFSSGSDQYIFQNKDILYFIKLGTNKVCVANNVSSYKTSNTSKWLAYQLKSRDSKLVLLDLATGKERSFTKVMDYEFDNSGKWLTLKLNGANENLLMYNLQGGIEKRFWFVESYSINQPGDRLLYQTHKITGSDTLSTLQYCNLANNDISTLWESSAKDKSELTSYSFDHTGRQLLYVLGDGTVPNQNSISIYSIWYYQEGVKSPVMKVNAETKGLSQNLILQGDASFSDNDRYIRFSTSKTPKKTELLTDPVSVDVWSSQDLILQSTQSYLDKELPTYACLINVNSDSVMALENEFEKLYDLKGDYALVKKSGKSVHGDRFWEKDFDKDNNFLVSLKDGYWSLLPTRGGPNTLWFSPDGRYLVYVDGERGCQYFSYDLLTATTKKISIGIPDGLLGNQVPWLMNEKPNRPVGTAAWLDDGKSLLVYDKYDIWQLDLTGEKPAINITNGYGRAHHIFLSLPNSDRYRCFQNILPKKALLYLCAFNTKTKENGFYLGVLYKVIDPKRLYMGDCFFWGQGPYVLTGLTDGMRPVKAKDANIWIVLRQTPTNAPNFYVTKDFKGFKQLTDLQPQKEYNWLTTKLISFKQLDGTQSQGVLYLPENFDSTKKYPVLISFYVQLSNRLYQYPIPEYIKAPFIFDNPAWIVSHGYLVFTPDIYFKKSEWGPSTVSAIDGAAMHLKALPYVDSNHLAATGHSNSGRFGYYLLTHSHSFAAMSIGSGFTGTDVISLALSLDHEHNRTSNLEVAERSAYGAGGLGNLWENKEKWIDHTAVLQADKATAPLLLFHNKEDGDDVRAAVELYTAFRRLQKPIWWLQYDKGAHLLTGLNDLRDFTIRYTQFFDHYLKGGPTPQWMKEEIYYKQKGIVSGFEFGNERHR